MEKKWVNIALKAISYITLTSLLIVAGCFFSFTFHLLNLGKCLVIIPLSSCCISLVVFKLKRKQLIILSSIGTFLMLHFLITAIARYAVHFIAWNITDSYAAKGSNSLINWDIPLMSFTYTLYAAFFIIGIIYLHLLLKNPKNTTNIKRIILGIYILSFPTIRSWRIDCSDFYGNCPDSLQLVTPIVMSINPIYIFISIITAILVLKIYSIITKITFI